MLASDEEGATLDALRFSLASDIVELVVLTTDEIFLQTLREAVGGARRLWHVASADKVSDLLVAGGVGILVLDVDTLNEAPPVFIGQIKRQFPDLVVEVAGNRDAETALAGLISAGTVYRFIHKPMSPARAKLFAEAAVKKYDEQRRRAAVPAPVKRQPQSNRGVLIAGALGALGAIVLAVWVTHRNSEQEAAPPHSTGVARPSPEESPLLAQAAAALAANRLTEPAGDNALELFAQALARNPGDAAARAGLAEVRERLLARAENAMLEERLDDAAAAIAAARTAGADGGRITFLTAQLAKSREQVKTAQNAVRVHNELKADADKLTNLVGLAAQRMNDAQLIDPARDSARFYVQEALRVDPNSARRAGGGKSAGGAASYGGARGHRRPRFCARVRSARGRQWNRGCDRPRGCARLAGRRAPRSGRRCVGSAAEERQRALAAGSARRTGQRQRQVLPADLARPGPEQRRSRGRDAGSRDPPHGQGAARA